MLMRHAKSSWSDPDLKDQERPLNARGRKAARVMGAWMKEKSVVPDLVLMSNARRSQETWERVSKTLDADIPAQVVDQIYMAGPEEMLSAVRGTPDDAKTVLVIGHQPGLSAFARKLANGNTRSGCKRAYRKFPTGAVAEIKTGRESWKDVTFGDADFTRFVCPRELTDD